MQLETIFELLANYIFIGLKVSVLLTLIFVIFYCILYKKIFNGKKKIKVSKISLFVISIIYICILVKATLRFNDFSGFTNTRHINLHLFSSYKEAYHNIDIIWYRNILFRNLILNICLFIPLGFLLPFYSKQLKKLYPTILIGFITTCIIEITQYYFCIGTFEIDDIFNNTLGTLLGYCFFQIFYNLKTKQAKKVLGYAIPFIITILAFVFLFFVYYIQEFGCLSFEYNYKINMSNIELYSDIDFSSTTSLQAIGYKKPLTKSEALDIASNIFYATENIIDYNNLKEFENSIQIPSQNTNCYIWIDYNGGNYRYVCGSSIDYVNNTIVFSPSMSGLSKEKILNILAGHNIFLPDNAIFLEKEDYANHSAYFLDFNFCEENNQIFDGNMQIDYYENGAITVINNIYTYSIIKHREIISEQEAFDKIKKGEFSLYDYSNLSKNNTLEIQNINLEYKLDSKGFYVPVYRFDTVLNNEKDLNIYIKAIP